MSNQDPHQPLEAFVHRALRELPAERAPADLEARVLAALQARQCRPWWQAGWRAWPVVPRTIVLAAATATTLVLAWGFLAGTQFAETFAWSAWIGTHAPWLATLGSVGATLFDALGLCVRKFQPYLLGLAVVVAAAYAGLIALGAGLYRSLIPHR
jgi:hypothetical protein